MPRQTKLTPEAMKLLCEGIRLRMSHKLAAMRAGISETTFYRWMQEGEAAAKAFDESEYPPEAETADSYRKRMFWEEVTRAIAEGQAALLAYVHRAAKQDWRAAFAILQARHRDDFGRSQRDEQMTEGITVIFNKPDIDPDEKGDELVFNDGEGTGIKPKTGNGNGNGGEK